MEPIAQEPVLLLLGWRELLIVAVPLGILIVGVVVVAANTMSKKRD